jgi:hypothetical protein
MTDHTHTDHADRTTVTKAEYEQMVEKLAADGARTGRQREVESAFGQSLPAVLRELSESTSSKSAMLRRINDTLEANGITEKVSRGTLYNWLDTIAEDE